MGVKFRRFDLVTLALVVAVILLDVPLLNFDAISSASIFTAHWSYADVTPTLTTDKPDYHPGEIVQISGNGFTPNTSYDIVVIRPDGSIIKSDGTPGFDTVIVDAVGSFVYLYDLDGIEGLYTVNAYDSSDTQHTTILASTTFTDAVQLTDHQCKNDTDNNDVVDSPQCTWDNGAIQSNNAILAEGNTVPPYPPAIPGHVNYRGVYEGLVAGTYVLTIEYDFSKGGTIAFDFLTTNYGVTDANLCTQPPELGVDDTTLCNNIVTSGLSTSTFPDDTADTLPAGLGAGDVQDRQAIHDTAFTGLSPRTMKIYGLGAGGSITGITNNARTGCLSPLGPMCNGDTSDSVAVTFVKTSGLGSPIMVTFGAHLGIGVAAPEGYESGNGAGSISGAPFHLSFENLARTTAPVDTQVKVGGDLQVQQGAIVTTTTTTTTATTSTTTVETTTSTVETTTSTVETTTSTVETTTSTTVETTTSTTTSSTTTIIIPPQKGMIEWEKRLSTTSTFHLLHSGAIFEITPDPTDGVGCGIVSDNNFAISSNPNSCTVLTDLDLTEHDDQDVENFFHNGLFKIGDVFIDQEVGTVYTIKETVAPIGGFVKDPNSRMVTVTTGDPNQVIGTQLTDDHSPASERDFHNTIPISNSNLMLASLSAPNSVTQNSPVTFIPTITIKNTGKSAITGFTVSIYLSTDNQLDTSDELLTEQIVSSTINVKKSIKIKPTVTISGETPKGTYYLIAVVDADNALIEFNEGDNTRVRKIIIK